MGESVQLMNATRTCSRCGTGLSPVHTRNLCPICLWDTALSFDREEETEIDDDPSKPRPARFGEDELLGELGRGAQGIVFRARHLRLGRAVALKTIPAYQLVSEQVRERFLLEARTAARLDHP